MSADAIDDAADLTLRMEEDALARVRNQLKPPPADWDGETCYECGRDYDENRRKAGYHICIDCKTEQEIREKQFSKRAR